MSFYFVIFLTLGLISLSSDFYVNQKKINSIILYFVVIFFILLIGFRDDVGGDWGRYEHYYNFDLLASNIFSIKKIFKSGHDFGFEFTQLVFLNLGFQFYFLTLFIASIFVYSLHTIANKNDYKVFTFLIAFPFIILIVGMGFMRQATALAFIILALDQLIKNRSLRFLFLLFVAISFHKSAIIFIPFYLIQNKKIKLTSFIFFLLLLCFCYFALYLDLTRLYSLYLGKDMHLDSQGAKIRYIFLIIPAIIFLFNSKLLSNSKIERKIYYYKSLFIIGMLPIVFYSSTSADRILIFFTTIQLIVYPRINRLFNGYNNSIVYVKYTHIFIIIFYLTFLFTWFRFSIFSLVWIPYKFFMI